jgi:hypothetical protein
MPVNVPLLKEKELQSLGRRIDHFADAEVGEPIIMSSRGDIDPLSLSPNFYYPSCELQSLKGLSILRSEMLRRPAEPWLARIRV